MPKSKRKIHDKRRRPSWCPLKERGQAELPTNCWGCDHYGETGYGIEYCKLFEREGDDD